MWRRLSLHAYFHRDQSVHRGFRQNDIAVIELKKGNTKEAVCLVFEKVNTGSLPLAVFELITASYAADGVNLRDEWFGNAKDKTECTRQYFAKHRMLRGIEPADFFRNQAKFTSQDTSLRHLDCQCQLGCQRVKTFSIADTLILLITTRARSASTFPQAQSHHRRHHN